MKKIMIIALCAIGIVANAQVSEQPHQTFFNSVTGYFSSFNTNFDNIFPTHRGSLWAGQNWQSGAHASTSLGLDYRVFKKLSLGSETRFEDITGNVASQQLSLGLGTSIHDVQITGLIGGVWRFADSEALPIVGLSAKKLLTVHTFAFVGLDIPIEKFAKAELKFGTGFVF